jgi:hypothetical protein
MVRAGMVWTHTSAKEQEAQYGASRNSFHPMDELLFQGIKKPLVTAVLSTMLFVKKVRFFPTTSIP